ELGPVELDVLTRGEMAIPAVVLACNVREFAQLPGRKHPIRDGHAKHWGVALNIEAIAQPERAKLIVCQLACQKTASLIAKLGYPLVDHPLIYFIVYVHRVTASLNDFACYQ